MKYLLSLALILCASAGFGVVATTTIELKQGGAAVCNHPTQAATNATENVVVLNITPGYKATVLLTDDAAWKYRGTTAVSTTDLLVAADRSYTIEITESTTFYTVRSTADGTLKIVPLRVVRNQ